MGGTGMVQGGVSYLLFLDESGHDHRSVPYEVTGGVAIHASKLWAFAQAMKSLEVSAFGAQLSSFGSEIKGHKLLDKDRFKWAAQQPLLEDAARRKHAMVFLGKGAAHQQPTKLEFTAYGQASLMMARGIFELLASHEATLFAAAIPRGVEKPKGLQERLRKDHVFLLERYFYFLESKQSAGLLVMDESEKTQDRGFTRRLERYFADTETGRFRTGGGRLARIVPTPFFVASDMTYPVQAADVCIYCLNWGFRLPSRGMDGPTRPEVASEFGPWLSNLQFEGDAYKDGQKHRSFGIVYVPDPYVARGEAQGM